MHLLHPIGTLDAYLATDSINATFPRQCWTFRAPRTGTLEDVALTFGTFSNLQSMRVSFQNRAAGQTYPDDVQDQYVDFTPTVSAINTIGPLTHDGTSGGNRRSVVKGEWVCLVLEFTGTVGAGNVVPYGAQSYYLAQGFQHRRSTTAWGTNNVGERVMAMGVRYADSANWAHVPGAQVFPIGTSQVAFSSSSSPDEIGFKFTCPIGGMRLAAITGIMGISQTNAQTFDLLLIDDATNTILQQTTFTQMQASGFSSSLLSALDFDRSTLVDLASGGVYRVTLRPNGTGSLTVRFQDYPSAALAAGTPLGQMSGHWTQRVNGGAWTDTTTRQPFVVPMWADDFEPPLNVAVFNPDDLAPVGLVWVEAYLPT